VDGDTASQIDADRVATTGVPVVQINTGGGSEGQGCVRAALPPEASLPGS